MIVGMIGIFTLWHISVEATLAIGNMLIAVFTGSMICRDAPVRTPRVGRSKISREAFRYSMDSERHGIRTLRLP